MTIIVIIIFILLVPFLWPTVGQGMLLLLRLFVLRAMEQVMTPPALTAIVVYVVARVGSNRSREKVSPS